MNVLPFTAMFIVIGTHITENLQHHKSADVKKILEEKGFKESPGSPADGGVHFYAHDGNASNGRRTVIVFGDQDFVLDDAGVRFYDSPEALKG